MVAINKVLLATFASTAVLASPVAQPNAAVAIQARDASASSADVVARDEDIFEALSTIISEIAQFVGNSLNDVLHLNLGQVPDDAQTLLSQLNSFLEQLLGGVNSFSPSQDATGQLQQAAVSNGLQNLLTGVASLVNNLLHGLLDANTIQDVAADLRQLVNNLDKLVTGLANNLVDYSQLTIELGSILSAVDSALNVGPISTLV